MSASRALGRWAFRLIRREFRQQLLVLSLVGVSLALVSLGMSLFINATTPRIRTGTATDVIQLSESKVGVSKRADTFRRELLRLDPDSQVETVLIKKAVRSDRAPYRFDVTDDRSTESFGNDSVRLRKGRMPKSSSEMCLSTSLLKKTRTSIGSTLTITGVTYNVVGEIEDPSNLRRLFAVVQPGTVRSPNEARLLVRAKNSVLNHTNVFAQGGADIQKVSMQTNQRRTSELVSLVMGSMAMLEVALLCTAGFGVLAKRRTREFALLAAIGARSRHLKRAMLLNGFAVGVIGGIAGLVAGFALSVVLQPWLEMWIGTRLGAATFPVSTLLPFLAIAVLASTAAAWSPARSVARAPIISSIKSRRPDRWPPHVLGTIGVALAIGGAVLHDRSVRTGHTAVAAIAFVSAVLGIVLVGPFVIVVADRVVTRLPLPARMASRNLSRNRTRSSLALAALVLALGGAVSIVVMGVFADAFNRSAAPRTPLNVSLIRPTSIAGLDSVPKDGFDIDSVTPALDAIRKAFPDATIVPVYVAAYPKGTPEPNTSWAAGPQRHVVRVSSVRRGPGFDAAHPDGRKIVTYDQPAWIATPALLAAWGLKPELATSTAGLLGPEVNQPYLNDKANDSFGSSPSTEQLGRYGNVGVPSYWLPDAEVVRRGYEPVLIAWTLRLPKPLTDFDSETLVAEAGDTLHFFHANTTPGSRQTMRRIALVSGSLLGLTILSIIGGLLRSESLEEEHAFIAVGARRRTRRAVSGATAGLLALYGALLAVPFGLLTTIGMRAAMRNAVHRGLMLPLDALSVVLVAFPLVASAAAWLLTSATPRALPRRM